MKKRAKVMARCERCEKQWEQRKDHWKKLEKNNIPHLCRNCANIRHAESTIKKLKEVDKAYIAGYLEADGCISWSSTQPQISIVSIDKEVLDWFVEKVGAGNIHQDDSGQKSIYRWMLNGRNNCREFLTQILPLMKLYRKRKSAEYMVNACQTLL